MAGAIFVPFLKFFKMYTTQNEKPTKFSLTYYFYWCCLVNVIIDPGMKQGELTTVYMGLFSSITMFKTVFLHMSLNSSQVVYWLKAGNINALSTDLQFDTDKIVPGVLYSPWLVFQYPLGYPLMVLIFLMQIIKQLMNIFFDLNDEIVVDSH